MADCSALMIPWANDTLCATCREVLARPIAVKYGERALRISAARKCGLCRFFFNKILASTFRLSQNPPDLVLERDGSRLRVTDFNDVIHDYELQAAQGSSTRFKTPFRLIQPHVNSEPCWNQIQDWLDRCVHGHNTCRQNALSMKPSRLVDVQSLRIVESADIGTDGRYAALSHCWSPGVQLRLTKATLQQYLRKIYLQDLPQNFQDAIFTARKLGISYLWIDSICILQDDMDDSKREAANVGNYYRNAFVVFSSLSASDGTTGFLRSRDPDLSTRLGCGMQIRQARPPWAHVFDDSPLSKRAWFFQQRLLSTRIIHFERNELFWECLEVSAREGSFVEISGLWNGDDWSPETLKRCLAFDYVTTSGVKPSQLLRDLLVRLWYRLLRRYTGLLFTHPIDILDAIAGIAQKFSEATRFSYFAGIWREDIHASLLWHCESPSKKHGEYTAPSWSWASSSGQKAQIYDLYSQRLPSGHEAEVISIEAQIVQPTGPFGTVSSASIVIDAAYFAARCQCSSSGSDDYGDLYLRQVLNISSSIGAFIGTGYWDNTPDSAIATCTALIISQRMDGTLGCVTYFLLVEEVPDSTKGTYVRIGIGQTADTTYGYATNALDMGKLERKRFKLI